jgi:hypothetical protein
MRHVTQLRRGWLAASIGGVAVGTLIATVGMGASANATSKTTPRARPHAAVHSGASASTTATVVRFAQEFTSNTKYFCPAGTGNQPCDGNPNPNPTYSDYGTIDRVASRFSNGGYGNYAPSTTAYYGGFMALVSGDVVGNQGTGCPQPSVTEYCTGPFALFPSSVSGTAGLGAANVFPSNGFTVTDDLYLSPTSAVPTGQLVDSDVELNNSTGGYGIDNVITACSEPGGFVINFGNGSPGRRTSPSRCTASRA